MHSIMDSFSIRDPEATFLDQYTEDVAGGVQSVGVEVSFCLKN